VDADKCNGYRRWNLWSCPQAVFLLKVNPDVHHANLLWKIIKNKFSENKWLSFYFFPLRKNILYIWRVWFNTVELANRVWPSCRRFIIWSLADSSKLGFFRNTVQTQILIHVWALTPMNIRTYTLPLWAHPKDWADLILRFTKSVTKSASLSTGTSSPTERIISRKCNTYVKSRIWTWVG
jgi:hypothetical protein